MSEKYSTVGTEMKQLLKRTIREFHKDSKHIVSRVTQTIGISILMAILFRNLTGYDFKAMMNMTGFLF